MKKNIPPQQLGSPAESNSGGPRQLRANESQAKHVPVLLQDTLKVLSPRAGESYLDLTAGYGGHARAVGRIIDMADATLVDRDSNSLAELQSLEAAGATLIHTDFVNAAHMLIEQGKQFDMVLVDLGVSSPQLDSAERGFSFRQDGPLDMRMDDRQEATAADIVNKSSKDALISIIKRYGEESGGRARQIAEAIVNHRPFHTTKALADVILATHRGRYQKTHPATRTFQAIRIALNQELQQVEQLLPLLPKLLKSGGRVAIISFHSLEDRLVKQYFKEQSSSGYEALFQLLNKQPIHGKSNDVHNPRARSAMLRAAVKK